MHGLESQSALALAPSLPATRRLSELAIGQFGRALRNAMPLLLDDLSTADDPRWLTCISRQAVKPLLRSEHNGDRNRVLQIVAREESELISLASRALRSGQSHTVALLVNELPGLEERLQLEACAEQGDCECLLIQVAGS